MNFLKKVYYKRRLYYNFNLSVSVELIENCITDCNTLYYTVLEVFQCRFVLRPVWVYYNFFAGGSIE